MAIKQLNLLLYFGLLLLTVGTVFKIQHWPYGNWIQPIGLLVEISFFVGVIVEVVTSKKASLALKATIVSIYILFPVITYYCLPALLLIFAILISGSIYLQKLRRKMLFSKAEIAIGEFDSL